MVLKITGDELIEEARRLIEGLEQRRWRIVFAESCTGGLVAAALVEVPGVSRCLCGSAAVYRDATKVEWLGVSPQILREHGAVSREATVQLAEQVLRRTSEADLSAAVSGYLGPDAPPGEEGRIHVAVALRRAHAEPKLSAKEHRLAPGEPPSPSRNRRTVREQQQRSAAYLVLREVNCLLDGASGSNRPVAGATPPTS
jgi:PncC family amidohydrolase